MRQISVKQASKNYTLAKIKKGLIEKNGCTCVICQGYGEDLMHLLPKSIYPEYYLKPENLAIGCRSCHNQFDDQQNFRKLQIDLYDQVCKFDVLSASRYFGFNN